MQRKLWSDKVEMNGVTGIPGHWVQGISNSLDLLECKEQGEEMRLVRWARP